MYVLDILTTLLLHVYLIFTTTIDNIKTYLKQYIVILLLPYISENENGCTMALELFPRKPHQGQRRWARVSCISMSTVINFIVIPTHITSIFLSFIMLRSPTFAHIFITSKIPDYSCDIRAAPFHLIAYFSLILPCIFCWSFLGWASMSAIRGLYISHIPILSCHLGRSQNIFLLFSIV